MCNMSAARDVLVGNEKDQRDWRSRDAASNC